MALRLVQTARLVPLGRWTTTSAVHAALADLGYHVTTRTVQRDLWLLARPFGLENSGEGCAGDPYRWRRTRRLEDLA